MLSSLFCLSLTLYSRPSLAAADAARDLRRRDRLDSCSPSSSSSDSPSPLPGLSTVDADAAVRPLALALNAASPKLVSPSSSSSSSSDGPSPLPGLSTADVDAAFLPLALALDAASPKLVERCYQDERHLREPHRHRRPEQLVVAPLPGLTEHLWVVQHHRVDTQCLLEELQPENCEEHASNSWHRTAEQFLPDTFPVGGLRQRHHLAVTVLPYPGNGLYLCQPDLGREARGHDLGDGEAVGDGDGSDGLHRLDGHGDGEREAGEGVVEGGEDKGGADVEAVDERERERGPPSVADVSRLPLRRHRQPKGPSSPLRRPRASLALVVRVVDGQLVPATRGTSSAARATAAGGPSGRGGRTAFAWPLHRTRTPPCTPRTSTR